MSLHTSTKAKKKHGSTSGIKADLGSVCVASGRVWVNSKHPNRATLYLLSYTSLCMES